MRLHDCANYIFLDTIKSFKFNKISNYNKSKFLYHNIINDFELVDELIKKEDMLNAAAILRSTYENIMYIITKSYNKELKITLDTVVGDFRNALEKNCHKIFTNYFEPGDFDKIYKYLCKIVHPCSLKEFASYINKTTKYKKYTLSNLKYMMIIIEYMYLNFLYKKTKIEVNGMQLNLIDLCTYANLICILYFINDAKNNKCFVKRYFYYDTNNKYISNRKNEIEEIYNELLGREEYVEKNVIEIATKLEHQIRESKYNEIVCSILKGKN